MEARTLLGLFADSKPLGRNVLDAVSALRGHHAPQQIHHVAIPASALLGEWRTLATF
jgi:hypothetical protein